MADHIARIDSRFAPELVGLWKQTFKQAYSDVHSADNIEQYCAATFKMANALAALSDKNIVCSFYRRDEKPIGFYILDHHDCPVPLTGKSSELKQIYILADAYGSGVGRAMFEDFCNVVRSVKESGFGWLLPISTIVLNHSTIRLAFIKLGGLIFAVGTDHLKSTIMACEIQTASHMLLNTIEIIPGPP